MQKYRENMQHFSIEVEVSEEGQPMMENLGEINGGMDCIQRANLEGVELMFLKFLRFLLTSIDYHWNPIEMLEKNNVRAPFSISFCFTLFLFFQRPASYLKGGFLTHEYSIGFLREVSTQGYFISSSFFCFSKLMDFLMEVFNRISCLKCLIQVFTQAFFFSFFY